jgi:uncharacterized membrane protein
MQKKYFNITVLYEILEKFDENKDGFLTYKEFQDLLNHLNINNKQIIDRILSRIIDKNNNNMISITNFVLFLIYFFKIYKNKKFKNLGNEKFLTNFNFTQNISSIKIREIKVKKFEKFLQKIPNFNFYEQKFSNILSAVNEYEKLMNKGIYSGAIIISKFFENNDLYINTIKIQRKLIDMITFICNISNEKIIFFFKKMLNSNNNNNNNNKSKNNLSNSVSNNFENDNNNNNISDLNEGKKPKTKISQLIIPEIKVIILDEKEMLELKNINRSN